MNCPLAAEKIATAGFGQIAELPDFDRELLDAVKAEARAADSGRQQRLSQLRSEQQILGRSNANLLRFISSGDMSETVRHQLRKNEEELVRIQSEIRSIESTPTGIIEIPETEVLKQMARDALNGQVPFSWDFNLVMQKLTPRIVVFPVRLLDGGHVEMRASFRLQFGELVDDDRLKDALRTSLERLVTVDVFDRSPETPTPVVQFPGTDIDRRTERVPSLQTHTTQGS